MGWGVGYGVEARDSPCELMTAREEGKKGVGDGSEISWTRVKIAGLRQPEATRYGAALIISRVSSAPLLSQGFASETFLGPRDASKQQLEPWRRQHWRSFSSPLQSDRSLDKILTSPDPMPGPPDGRLCQSEHCRGLVECHGRQC